MTADANVQPVPSPRGELPPLRIHHFLVWTAVMAATLVPSYWSSQSESTHPVQDNPVYRTTHVFGDAISSAAVTCLGFGVYWRWRGLRFPSEPGHGLVILFGVGSIIWRLAFAVYAVAYLRSEDPAQLAECVEPSVPRWVDVAYYFGLEPITHLTLVALAIGLAVRLVRGWRWRTVFLLVAIFGWLRASYDGLLRSLFRITQWEFLTDWWRGIHFGIGTIPSMILLAALLMAVVHDRRRGLTFHWSHWVGVAVAAATAANLLGWYAYSIASSWLRS